MSRHDGHGVESSRGIGRMARESGLTVSALRFYDGAGVLTPDGVDPRTGYRAYAPEQVVVGRLVAVLRRVGMPLAGIRAVLAQRHDPAGLDALLAEHLHRLEQGLTQARRELSRVRSLLEPRENPMTTATVDGPELAAALRRVRFAVGTDPDLPALRGVLVEIDAAGITLVATDRYRLAVATLAVRAMDGPPVAVVVPAGLVDRIAATGPVTITADGTTITLPEGDVEHVAEPIPDAFPDHRRLLPTPGAAAAVHGGLRAALATAPTRTMTRGPGGTEFEVAVLGRGPDGAVVVVDPDGEGVGVNRGFLLEAIDAGGPGQLELALDGPIAPLVLRTARSVSLLMPVRR